MQHCCFCKPYIIRSTAMLLAIFRLALLESIVFFPSFGFSNTFVDLKTSEQVEDISFIKSHGIMIYVEADCEACKKYLHQLSSCSEVQRENIHILSMSSPVQTKKAFRKYLNQFRFLVLNRHSGAKTVFATPTTRLGDETRIGLMSCQEFAHFIARAQKASAEMVEEIPSTKSTEQNIIQFRKVGFENEEK